MNINPNISFGASFIKEVNVKKLVENSKSYITKNVSCVELDPLNKADVKAINETQDAFYGVSFVDDIFFNAKKIFRKGENKENMQIYALTTQKDNFEKLDADKVLVMADVVAKEDNGAYLEYIQAHPLIAYAIDKPPYKNVGTELIKILQEKFSSIKCNSIADGFYEKNGFIREKQGSNHFIWNKSSSPTKSIDEMI